jgi:twinkle protein
MAKRDAEWLRFVKHLPCPSCNSSDALALYGDGHTYCWSCGAYTDKEGGGSTDDPHSAESEDGLRKVKNKLVRSHPKALRTRAIREETVAKFGYGFGKAYNPETRQVETCQVAPYFDAHGKLIAQKLRFKGKVFTVRGNIQEAQLFGQHLWKPGPKRTVVITEGEIDALAVSQVQDNKWAVVSLRQGANSISDLPRAVDWLDQFGRIVLMFDQDKAGREAAEEAAMLLPPGKVFIASLPLKDASDMLKEGRVAELSRAIWEAKEYRPDGLVWGAEAWELYTRIGGANAIPYSHPGLDTAMEGHRDSEIITICAGTMVGKSAWVREEIAAMNAAGIRVGLIALEEPIRRQIQGLCSIAMEKPLHLRECADIPDEEIQRVFMETYPNIVFDNHQGSIASDRLIQKMRYMARGLGCRRIVLDHLTILVAGQEDDNERKVIDLLLTNLVSLTEETGVGIFLVCHLKRPKDGRGFEQGRRVTLGDLRGSSMIEALSNDVIALERDIEADDENAKTLTDIHVLKCRYTADVGYKGHLRWHGDRCRLLPEEVHEFDIDADDGIDDAAEPVQVGAGSDFEEQDG